MSVPDPAFAQALRSLQEAIECQRQGHTADAERVFARLVKKHPDYFDALHFFALFKFQHGKSNDALHLLAKAIKVHPRSAHAHNSHGAVLSKLGRHAEAVAAYDRALAIDPGNVNALNNRGHSLAYLGRREEAIACYDKVLAQQPNDVAALTGRSNMLFQVGRLDEALPGYDKALAFTPNHVEALVNRGTLCVRLGRYADAVANFERAAVLDPGHPKAFNAMLELALGACDWNLVDKLSVQAARRVDAGAPVDPFLMLLCSDQPALHLKCAALHLQTILPVLPQPQGRRKRYSHDKIRLAYLSADFHAHATARLIAELIELHDRTQFEIICVSYGPDDNSPMRARLTRAFDHFHDVRAMSDKQVAELLQNRKVDIAVDLKGYTTDSRPGILAYRPAPIQVSFIGYGSTMAAPFIDYILADNTVLPLEQQTFYVEQIVRLPNSYQVNDTKTKIADETPTRQDCGLPDHGFVFCCFNNTNKITRALFDRWCRLLANVENSVLWLLGDSLDAELNLRREALARGLAPTRLIFARKLPLAEHLARHRLADLFLDTLPYNAHTTASDALWAGLPVLTCTGGAFPGRVASSLLLAAGLPELVTSNLDDYERLASRLASDADLRSDLREKLLRNRLHCPLFDAPRFCRHIERAYTTMLEILRRGANPESFSVEQ